MRKFNFRESCTLNFQFWLNMPLYRIHKFVYDTEQSCWKMPQMPRCLCINTAPFCIRFHPTFQCTHCALSRLLSNQKTATSYSKAELEEEFTLPPLKVKEEVVIKKEEKLEEVAKVEVKEEREEVDCPRERVSSSESSNFTLRNSQSGANLSSFQPSSIKPVISPFSVPPPPLFTPHYVPLSQTPQYCQMPAANWGFCGGCQCWGPVIPILAVQ